MKDILAFLTELSYNNNREWFNEHKDWYVRCQKQFEQFTAQWLERLVEIDPEMKALTPKDCIWRIYRDVRFSHDKRPFKEWFGAFPAVKGGKKSDRGGYYVHLQPGKCMFAGGIWCPNKDLLHALRREILANYDEVEDIFYDICHRLIELDNVDLSKLYIDGTKIEANAKKNSFVWKKSLINRRNKVFEKTTVEITYLNTQYKFNYEKTFLSFGCSLCNGCLPDRHQRGWCRRW